MCPHCKLSGRKNVAFKRVGRPLIVDTDMFSNTSLLVSLLNAVFS